MAAPARAEQHRGGLLERNCSIHSYPARFQFSLAAFERLKEHIGNECVRFQSSVFRYLLKKTSLIFLLDLSQESQFRSRSARRGDMERLISEQPYELVHFHRHLLRLGHIIQF